MVPTSWSEALRCELAEIDASKQVDRLEALHAELSDETGAAITSTLIQLCAADSAKVQVGASWLLRARLEQLAADERAVAPSVARELASRLPAVRDKWARQHLCQCLSILEVPATALEAFADFCRDAAASEAKFLRAWGIDGLLRLAWQHSSLTDEAVRRLDLAEEDDAASVRARARQLRKELERRS